MDEPLSLSTVDEAVAWLVASTGQAWTASRLFNKVVDYGLTLRAAPPPEAAAVLHRFTVGEGMVREGFIGWCLADLAPFHVAQVWLSGRSLASRAAGLFPDGEYAFFDPPLSVTVADVRIPRDVLFMLRKKCPSLPASHEPRGERTLEPSITTVTDKWSRGLKRIAWEEAWKIIAAKDCLTGDGLYDAMAAHGDVTATGDVLTYAKAAGNLKGGEESARAGTIRKDWRKQLDTLLAASAAA